MTDSSISSEDKKEKQKAAKRVYQKERRKKLYATSQEFREKISIKGKEYRKSEKFKKWWEERKKSEKYKEIKERIRIYTQARRDDPSQRDILIEQQRKYREKYRIPALARAAIHRAKKKGLPYHPDYLKNVIGNLHPINCPCCGIVLEYKFNGGRPPFDAPSLDRIDTLGGYTEGNIDIICWRCNAIKRDATLDELEKIVTYMRARLL